MQDTAHTNLILRDHTVLGVCEALGEDFGINATLLRIAAAIGLLVNPQAVLAGYLSLGAVILLSRLVFPNPRAKPAASPEAPAAQAPAAEEEQHPLPLAA
jgi:phage shock protein PspC (stress-responsive transcriptional regulator)